MNLRRLPFANLRGNPARTAGLVLLSALLSFALFAGMLSVASLQNGLESLAARLGTDILVAPDEATVHTNLKETILNGVPGQFYMDKSHLDEVAHVEGVEAVSPQYYLATLEASCCTIPIQVIGFDPETDFSIQPWVERSLDTDLERGDVAIGCNVGGNLGMTMYFYGVESHVVARLDKTGTGLDDAVFVNPETMKDFIEGSKAQGADALLGNDPDEVVSTIQVKVADGYEPSDVVARIKDSVDGVYALETQAMMSGVSHSIEGASRMLGALVMALAVLSVAFLVVAFALSTRSRQREFAVLRMTGASRSMLSHVVATEAATVGVLGALLGIVVGLVVFYAFGTLLETSLSMPFLIPNTATVALYGLIAFCATLAACVLSSAASSKRLSRVAAGQVLREG